MPYISEIQKRLSALVGDMGLAKAKEFVVSRGAREDEISDPYHAALWIEGAPKEVKQDFLSLWEDCCNPRHLEDTGLRICDACGKFMTEGYILGGDIDYACSRECAVTVTCRQMWYGNKAENDTSFRNQAEMELDGRLDLRSDDYFWTEWYQG